MNKRLFGGQPPSPRSLAHWENQEGQGKEGQKCKLLPLRHPPASALGSLSSVALSSGQVTDHNLGCQKRKGGVPWQLRRNKGFYKPLTKEDRLQ